MTSITELFKYLRVRLKTKSDDTITRSSSDESLSDTSITDSNGNPNAFGSPDESESATSELSDSSSYDSYYDESYDSSYDESEKSTNVSSNDRLVYLPTRYNPNIYKIVKIKDGVVVSERLCKCNKCADEIKKEMSTMF